MVAEMFTKMIWAGVQKEIQYWKVGAGLLKEMNGSLSLRVLFNANILQTDTSTRSLSCPCQGWTNSFTHLITIHCAREQKLITRHSCLGRDTGRHWTMNTYITSHLRLIQVLSPSPCLQSPAAVWLSPQSTPVRKQVTIQPGRQNCVQRIVNGFECNVLMEASKYF